jgi:hypothetical protein
MATAAGGCGSPSTLCKEGLRTPSKEGWPIKGSSAAGAPRVRPPSLASMAMSHDGFGSSASRASATMCAAADRRGGRMARGRRGHTNIVLCPHACPRVSVYASWQEYRQTGRAGTWIRYVMHPCPVITETIRMQLALLLMQNRPFTPYLAAIESLFQ